MQLIILQHGVTVSSIEADSEASSLFLTVDVTGSSGSLEVSLDRTFFDSKFEGIDDEFFILDRWGLCRFY